MALTHAQALLGRLTQWLPPDNPSANATVLSLKRELQRLERIELAARRAAMDLYDKTA